MSAQFQGKHMRWSALSIFGVAILAVVVLAMWQLREPLADRDADQQAQPADVAGPPADDSSLATETIADTPPASPKPAIPDVVAALELVSSQPSPARNEVVLAEEKQKKIWDSEHSTFELETYFGKAMRKAISDRDPEAIANFFVDGASIELIPLSEGESGQAATVAEERAEGSANESSDIAGLATHLIESLKEMQEIQRTKLRVLQLQTEDGAHWDSRFLLKFVGTDAGGRPLVVESHHELELQFTSDDEIKAGRIISSWHDESRSIRQSDQVLMSEVTEQVGLDRLTLPDNWTRPVTSRSQYWFQFGVADFNRDGFPDIAAATITGQPLLLQSDQGQRFDDITDRVRLKESDAEHMHALATWIDYNDDGWPDLLLGNRLYRNVKGQAFLDVTAKSGLEIGHFPMGAAVADYDCDGLNDIYILYQHHAVRSSDDPMPWVGDNKTGVENQLWHNEGGGRFRNVTEEAKAGGGTRHSFAAVWHFLDDDRYPDLYIANDFGQNVHLRNVGDGTFEDVSAEANTADFATSMGVTSGDLNNDGKPELYVANMFSKMGRRIIGGVCADDYPPGIYEQIQGSCAGNRLYTVQGDDETFVEISELAGVNEVGWAYAPTMADFDSDGLLDIYATTGFMSATRGKPDG